MKNLIDISLHVARKLANSRYILEGQLDKSFTDIFHQENSDYIRRQLQNGKPLMISRLGSTELNCIVNYLDQKKKSNKYSGYVLGKNKYYKWEKSTIESIQTLSGFFPNNISSVERFCEQFLEDLPLIDILGSWLKQEAIVDDYIKNAHKIGFLNLEPYNHIHPWSEVLENKTVLVVHPFEESIKHQYLKRSLLFKDPRVLPTFELKTIKAVQSVGSTKSGFATWFDALEFMKNKISVTEFDVAIIGCGAYGLPLAAHVKRLGKMAVHLGGPTQLLFGIRGKRWEDDYNGYQSRLMNEYWVKPLENEKPLNFKKVEGGCYW